MSEIYKIFRKNSNLLKTLTPLNPENVLKCAKLITQDNVYIGYNEDCKQYIEIEGCPRIYLGVTMECKNLDKNTYEVLGKLIDLQYDECSRYLFVFE